MARRRETSWEREDRVRLGYLAKGNMTMYRQTLISQCLPGLSTLGFTIALIISSCSHHS